MVLSTNFYVKLTTVSRIGLQLCLRLFYFFNFIGSSSSGSIPNPTEGDELKSLPPKPALLTPSRAVMRTPATNVQVPSSSPKEVASAISLKAQDQRPPVVRQIHFVTDPKTIKVRMGISRTDNCKWP